MPEGFKIVADSALVERDPFFVMDDICACVRDSPVSKHVHLTLATHV